MSNASLQRKPLTRSTTTTVKFSVVTPTLNADRYLGDCLKSIADQDSPGIEIEHLILDGGSTDSTLDMLEHADVRFVARQPTDGLVQAMRLGYSHAEGDLIGYLGADDVYAPGALATVADVYRRERRQVILGRARWTNENLESRGELSAAPHWMSAAAHASLGWNYLGAANAFVTPQLYKDIGGFREDFTKAEDYEFFTRVLAKRIPFSRVDTTVSLFRRHGDNSSLEHDEKYFRDVNAVLREYGPKSKVVQRLYCNFMKSWIYLRHPEWAYHQLRNKIVQRRLHGSS